MRRLIIFGLVIAFFVSIPVSAQTNGARLAFISRSEYEGKILHIVQAYDFDMNMLSDLAVVDEAHNLSWSHDGKLAFAGREDDIYAVYVWDGDTEVSIIAEGADNYSHLTWSRAGRLAFVSWFYAGDGSQTTDLEVWDGKELFSPCSPPENCIEPAWNNDNTLAYTAPEIAALPARGCGDCDPPPEFRSGIRVWDSGFSGTVVSDPVQHFPTARHPHWMLDGRLLYTAVDGSTIRLMSWDGIETTGIPLRPLIDGSYYWSADGNLAILSSPYGVGMVNVDVIMNAAGTTSARAVNIIEGTGFVEDVTWSRDGRLAFHTEIDGDYGVFVWDGNMISPVAQSHAYDKSPAWSENGRLAFVSDRMDNNFDLYVWNGQEAVRLLALDYAEEDAPMWWMPGG